MPPVAATQIRRIKILSMGEPAVGKSCLIKRFCEEKFVSKYVTTIGIDYGVKPVQVQGHGAVRVNFWDVAGGEEYFDIRNEFYRDVQAAVCIMTPRIMTMPLHITRPRVQISRASRHRNRA